MEIVSVIFTGILCVATAVTFFVILFIFKDWIRRQKVSQIQSDKKIESTESRIFFLLGFIAFLFLRVTYFWICDISHYFGYNDLFAGGVTFLIGVVYFVVGVMLFTKEKKS